MTDKWTVLTLDLKSILLLYLNRRFVSVKGFKLCAHMFVRNVFTSNNLYNEIDFPRDMQFFLAKVALFRLLCCADHAGPTLERRI